MTPERIAKGLIASAEAVHTDAVTWETFRHRNAALWDRVKTSEAHAEVLALLRNHEERQMAKKKKAATKKAKAEATADTNGKFAETKPKQPAKKEKKPKEDLVVFAFRLKAEERDLIHEAAGPAKASKYVRALVLAASKGDEKSVVDIVRAVKSAS